MSDFENLENYEPSSEDDAYRVGGRDIAFLAAGIAIGAGLTILLTPKRGREVRRAIGRGCRRLVDELSDRGHDLKEELRERADDLRERAPNLLSFGRHTRMGGRWFREG
jgi:hypothetical protein